MGAGGELAGGGSSWGGSVLAPACVRVLTALIALIALTVLKAAPSSFGACCKQPVPSRLPRTFAARAAPLMERGHLRGNRDQAKAHPDVVPTGAAFRFGWQRLKALCSSKEPRAHTTT